jgi:hypothetical protein
MKHMLEEVYSYRKGFEYHGINDQAQECRQKKKETLITHSATADITVRLCISQCTVGS